MFLSLLTGSGLISLILFSVLVATVYLGSNVTGVVLVTFGFMLLGVLFTVDVVDTGMPDCLSGCSHFGLLVGGIGIS